MKILSDFDGVLTDQIEEAQRVRELFREGLIRDAGLSETRADEWISVGEEEMNRAPHRHGWRSEGRITAFANEDLFIRNNALGSCFDSWVSGSYSFESSQLELSELKDSDARLREKEISGFNGLANLSYNGMVSETKQGKMKPMDPLTREIFPQFVEEGNPVVVVSNSGTDRILDLFNGENVSTVAHDADPSHSFRIRGGAMKFGLGEVAPTLSIGDYEVEVSRPNYEKIILEEKPGMVIGDVFSLDLALPLALSQTHDALKGIQLVLRVQPYTPKWAIDFMEKNACETARLYLMKDLSELPGIVAQS